MDATTFPISFTYHLIFAIVAGVFFLIQFIRHRKPYQLIFAIAIPASLLIYIDETSKTLFNTVGAFELVMILGAIVLTIVFHVTDKKEAAAVAEGASIEAVEAGDASAVNQVETMAQVTSTEDVIGDSAQADAEAEEAADEETSFSTEEDIAKLQETLNQTSRATEQEDEAQ